jgi:hypothetical protein
MLHKQSIAEDFKLIMNSYKHVNLKLLSENSFGYSL